MNTVLRFCLDVLRTARERRSTAAMLQGLDDRLLEDVGIDRGTIDDYVANGYRWPTLAPTTLRVRAPSLQGCG